MVGVPKLIMGQLEHPQVMAVFYTVGDVPYLVMISPDNLYLLAYLHAQVHKESAL